MTAQTIETSVNQWGNGLAIRLTKSMARTAGVSEGSLVRVSVNAGRIVVEVATKKATLDEMLAKFDRARHGGEVMAFRPVGVEAM